MEGLIGKVALVTGAGRKTGMGRAIAHHLARDGADIVVTDIAAHLKQDESEEPWGLKNLVEEIEALGRGAF